MYGTPSMPGGTSIPCQWIDVVTSILLFTRIRAVSPSVNRRMGPGMPSFITMGSAIVRNDMATGLSVIDKLATFAEVYGLVAVGSILVVSGAIKTVGSVAGAIMSKQK